MITAFQRWAPPELIGRLAGLLTLASLGIYPATVELAAGVVHSLGPAAFIPIAGAALGLAICLGLSQRVWRDFGVTPGHPATGSAVPEAGSSTDDTPETVRYAS